MFIFALHRSRRLIWNKHLNLSKIFDRTFIYQHHVIETSSGVFRFQGIGARWVKNRYRRGTRKIPGKVSVSQKASSTRYSLQHIKPEADPRYQEEKDILQLWIGVTHSVQRNYESYSYSQSPCLNYNSSLFYECFNHPLSIGILYFAHSHMTIFCMNQVWNTYQAGSL